MSLSFCRNLKWWWQHTRQFLLCLGRFWWIFAHFKGRNMKDQRCSDEIRANIQFNTKYNTITFSYIQVARGKIHLHSQQVTRNTFQPSNENSLCRINVYSFCCVVFFFYFIIAFDSHKRLWFVSCGVRSNFKLCTFNSENSLYTRASLGTAKSKQFNLPHFI